VASPPPAEDTGLTREQVERLRQTAAANSAARAGPHAEFRAREHARRKRDRSRAAGIAWIAGFGLFALLALGAVLFRDQVAEAFPKAASLYRMVGLEVNRFGLSLENVNAKRSFDGTTPVLTVTGVAVNKTEERHETPKLRVVLRDEDGKQVKEWTDKLSVGSLGPGERVEFESRFDAPPVETYRLTVTFAPQEGQTRTAGETTLDSTDIESGKAAPKPATEGAAGAAGGAAASEAENEHAEPVKQEAGHN